MTVRQDVQRRVKALVDYINGVDPSVFDQTAKDDVNGWLLFMSQAPDSTFMMQWYWPFHSVFGYYIAAIGERIEQTKLRRDRISAHARKTLQNSRSGKVTEGEAKMQALLDPAFGDACSDLSALERLYDFMQAVKEGLDIKLVEAYGNNQRLEMRQDYEQE